MDTHSPKFKIRLGLFVASGFILLLIAIFLIGRQKNLFNPVFVLNTNFHSVSGLQVGNNVRFSGINVGTVDNIIIINDSTVKVNMIVRKDVQQFIKNDCKAAISSEGIIGDRVLIITQGSTDAPIAKSGQSLLSVEAVEPDAIMASLLVTAKNAEIISFQLAEITVKINEGSGILGMLIQDSTVAQNINQTLINLRKSSKGLDENMKAAQSNFLLKGYFKRKEKKAEKAKQDSLRSIDDNAKNALKLKEEKKK